MPRRSTIIITFVLSILVVQALLYYVLLPLWLRQKLSDFNEGKSGETSVEIKQIQSTLWPIGIGLKNVTVIKSDSTGLITDSLSLGRIAIRGFHLMTILFQKKYALEKISIDHIHGAWTLQSLSDSTHVFTSPFDAICRNVEIRDINLRLKKIDSNQETTVEDALLVLTNISLQKDSTISSHAFQIHEVSIPFIQFVSEDSLYTYRAHQLTYTEKNKSLKVDSFFTLPNYNNYAFARRNDFQIDRLHVELSGVSLAQFDLNSLLADGDLYISSITIDRFLLDLFRDRRLPFLHKNRPLYQDILHAYPGTLSIDSITAHHGHIIYAEQDKNAPEPGKIWFTDVTATLKHLYNDSTLQMVNDSLIVSAKALAMDKGEISFRSSGYLFDLQNTFTFSGRMEKIPVAAFNTMLRPNASLLATEGYVKGISFNFVADHTLAKGDLLFYYNDLYLEVVNKENGVAGGLKNRILSTALNRKILDANPLPNDTLRQGQIQFERDPEKMYFSYILKSVFSGIKTSVEK